jgi:hypothetical protein
MGIVREPLPCLFSGCHYESHGFKGGRYECIEECGRDQDATINWDDFDGPCGTNCPGYEPVPIENCPKHGAYIDQCDYCFNEQMCDAETLKESK